MKPTPFVSVIIPVFNDSQRLARCLASLEEQTYPSDCFEVLVVDNASTEDLKPVVDRFPHAKYLHEAKRGSYAARNHALANAAGSIMAFTDSDCVAAKDWLQQGVNELSNFAAAGLIAGKIELFCADENHPTPIELYELATGFPQRDYIENSHFGATANVFTPKETFASTGPFNDSLQSGGDAEWGRRVYEAGLPLRYCDSIVVRHPARRTFGEITRKMFRVAKGHVVVHGMPDQKGFARVKVIVGRLIPPFKMIRHHLTQYERNSPSQFGNRLKLIVGILYVTYCYRLAKTINEFKAG